MVVLSLEEYAKLTDGIEMKLDEADRQAVLTEERLSHETVFSKCDGSVSPDVRCKRYGQIFITE